MIIFKKLQYTNNSVNNTINFNYYNYRFEAIRDPVENNANVLFLVKVFNTEEQYSSCVVSIVQKINTESVNTFAGLTVTYREPSYAFDKILDKKDKYTDKEILISRTIDKIIRHSVALDQETAINIILTKNQPWISNTFFAAVSTLIAYKTISACEIGFCHLYYKNDSFSREYIKDYSAQLLMAANKTQIFSIEMESLPNVDTLQLLQTGIAHCDDLAVILQQKIKSPKSKVEPTIPVIPKITDHLQISSIKPQEMPFELFKKAVSAYFAKHGRIVPDEVRPITIQEFGQQMLFSRGPTAVLDNLQISNEQIGIISSYKFNSFATGEIYSKAFSRREIGHGEIIRSAFSLIYKNILSFKLDSEVLSASGSSSMASICAGSAILKKYGFRSNIVAGISIGLFRNGMTEKLAIDIWEFEDLYGEMDFKIAGTLTGFTCIHMDCKSYLNVKSLKSVLQLARQTIDKIINAIDSQVLTNIENVFIQKQKWSEILGNHGNNLKLITQLTGAIVKTNDGGYLSITGKNIEICKQLLLTQAGLYMQDGDPLVFIAKEASDKIFVLTPLGLFKNNKKIAIIQNQLVIAQTKSIKKKTMIIEKISNNLE